MPELIQQPTRIPAAGGKTIDEHVGLASTGHDVVSVACMSAPGGWTEPHQCPEFDEVTVLLSGLLLVDHDGGQARVKDGQAIIVRRGERVRYTAGPDGARYLSICLPAFSQSRAHRED